MRGSSISILACLFSSSELINVKALFRDEAGFERFYLEHAGRVYALLLRMLREERDAQDVLQESFMQAWRRRNDYEPDRGSTGAWITTIAKSRALDHLRAARSSIPACGDHPPMPDRYAEHDVTSRIEKDRIREMLSRLPGPQRTTIELAYFEGYSQTEIALRLGIPVGTVKTRVLLGMHRLREQLAVRQEQAARTSASETAG